MFKITQSNKSKTYFDFLRPSSSTWNSILIASGTVASTSDINHPGVNTVSSSTSANSGAYVGSTSGIIRLSGIEKNTVIFKTPANATNVTRYTGFHNSISHTAPSYGVYANMSGLVISGKSINGEGNATTSSTFTLTADTWYRLTIEIKSTKLAIFTVYADNSNTILWRDTLTTNLPTSAGEEVRTTDVITHSGTSAKVIGSIDYIDIEFSSTRII